MKELSDEELHFLGIKVVYKDLVDKGYEVLNVRQELDVNPQILALKEGKRFFIVVRTERFPRITSYNVCYTKLLRRLRHFFVVRPIGIGNTHAGK